MSLLSFDEKGVNRVIIPVNRDEAKHAKYRERPDRCQIIGIGQQAPNICEWLKNQCSIYWPNCAFCLTFRHIITVKICIFHTIWNDLKNDSPVVFARLVKPYNHSALECFALVSNLFDHSAPKNCRSIGCISIACSFCICS